ncbi:WcbI family polysaccharide biosynthesis putative acetyltransferase [Aliiglaciecola litoralis]|uniref:Polysaccharide biosynthesis enzyme WcbI domain-containing protein n=1 Tax=Aliiglaciecola litoralis TaxID=582857 RepID=A0ABP3WUD3_9ALTE
MKKKFAVYGNCQASPIAKLLLNNETFNNQFELVKFSQPVFMLSNKDWPHILDVVSSVDLLICQKVGDAFGDLLSTDNLFAHAKTGAIKMSYPSIYFNGYFTEIDYLRGMPNEINQFSDYHDLNIADNFLQSDSIEQAKQTSLEQLQDPDFYSPNDVLAGIEKSIAELKSREVGLDTQVANFIQQHWHEEQLFFSVNHPSRRLLLDVCQQILVHLEITDKSIPGSYEHLGETILPLYHSVQKHMIAEHLPVTKVKGHVVTLESYVSGLIDIYAKQEPQKLAHVVSQLWQKRGC